MPLRSYFYAFLYLLTGVLVFSGLLGGLTLAIRLGHILPTLGIGALLGFCIVLTLFLCSSLLPRFNFGYSAFWRGSSRKKWVALTFDDGPSEPYTSQILDVLKQCQVPATFFVVGQNVERYPEVVQRTLQEGHEVGNHTWDHRPLIFMSKDQIENEFDAWEKIMRRVGELPSKLFRAPRGWKSPFLSSVLKKRGYRLVAWTRGVWDTDRPGVDVLYRRLTKRVSNGEIILLHDGGGPPPGDDRSQTVRVLKGVIEAYKNQGFQFVTLPEMMASP